MFVVGVSEVIVYNGGSPWLYCYGWSPFWRTFLQPYTSLALLLMCGYWLYAMATYGVVSGKSAGALLMIFLIGNLDGWARVFFALGKSCG
jgi:hypothetical protein